MQASTTGNSKIRHEEAPRIRRATDGKERSPKGKAKHKDIEAKAKPRANEASLRFEGNCSCHGPGRSWRGGTEYDRDR